VPQRARRAAEAEPLVLHVNVVRSLSAGAMYVPRLPATSAGFRQNHAATHFHTRFPDDSARTRRSRSCPRCGGVARASGGPSMGRSRSQVMCIELVTYQLFTTHVLARLSHPKHRSARSLLELSPPSAFTAVIIHVVPVAERPHSEALSTSCLYLSTPCPTPTLTALTPHHHQQHSHVPVVFGHKKV
jgi:hypothetical protein